MLAKNMLAAIALALVAVSTSACEGGAGGGLLDTPAPAVDAPAPPAGEPGEAVLMGSAFTDSGVEVSYECDETGFAFNIDPNTAEAQELASRKCDYVHVLDSVEWPGGLHLTTLPNP